MQKEDKCICQYDDWHNGFGDKNTILHRGMRLTVKGVKNVAGAPFYAFHETPDDNWFLASGFLPLRNLN